MHGSERSVTTKLVNLDPDRLVVSPELGRSGSAKQFEDRLKASIEQIGLAEPIKVAPLPRGRYLVVDGMMRLRAVQRIREESPSSFATVPAYVVAYAARFELRYQSDIYQDLLPSQLAALVEHLHEAEHVAKVDIARYIGVSPPTLRNYTGLWRMLQRGGIFGRLVDLMDVAVIPSSNPYAWLRLTAQGVRHALELSFTDGLNVDAWIELRIAGARRGDTTRFPLKFVEAATDSLPPEYYRKDAAHRNVKRDLGLRRAKREGPSKALDMTEAVTHLTRVSRRSQDPVLRSAARSLRAYLQ
jgi:ParB-like chromosome segregation protein Spo0J